MREAAQNVMTLGEPRPRLDELTDSLRGNVRQLVPALQTLINAQPAGDVPAAVAQVGIDEAWRRLHTPRGFGPDAAYQHARKLALSVQSLCDHYENLRRPSTTAS
ncbi:DUF6415 family natural product biosynthesis protein [Streptomyces sp. NPDC096153]|uniref:DUF6415 family natural product biosynthesis protein n=1 Tax=Streptomyces sp. NPDC096153 TaxID=3155548 RepID=UPI0033207FFB